MRLKPQAWFLISLLLFAAAICTWHHAETYAAKHRAATAKANALQQPPLIKTLAANAKAKRTSYRIRNTTQTLAQLLHNSHALILRNALIDTEVPVALDIPAHLRAKGAPGSYLVQADRPLDKAFYAELREAGASYISYVPNNAALVTASPEQATNLAANADVVAVLPYEPYYKLDSALLPSAVEQEPQTNALSLSVTTFAGQRDAALAALTQLGAKLIGEDRSPFGPTLIVSVPPESLTAVAQLPLAQEIEVYTPRHVMNDLTRVIMNDATNTLIGTPNYLNLTGSNVTVNINDTGVDATHPDFLPTNRLQADFPNSLIDYDGHGTHVAGIIAGNGSKSTTVTNYVPGSITTNATPHADFRGKATNATLYVQSLDLTYGPFISDSFLQENASANMGPTNLISNNSWGYGSTVYDMHAASFDAATRDAQPDVDGEQPLLFVFAAGNNGNDGGTIDSPATAKNVITVAASDSPRFITNEVYEGTNTNDISEVWLDDTDNTNYVASFSSAGNVDVGIEGLYGRFKPDVIAPGVFTVSCRATTYVDPSNSTIVFDDAQPIQTVTSKQTNYYAQYLLTNADGYTTSGLTVVISSNAASPVPFPNMLILAGPNYPPTTVVSSNNYYALTNFTTGQLWWFGVTAPTNSPGPVNYNLDIYLFETNYLGDYFTVLSNLNNAFLGSDGKKWYRYDSGTSMSAGAVSGILALMQEFLQSHTPNTNPSPALLKAMLINGSRTLGPQYDFDVNTEGANVQGWGLPNLTNSVPASLTNTYPSMLLIDQSPSNALATGQYKTYTINCADPNATNYPLRISLVWTDPPGDPAAGVALVNNLDLTAADATGSNIYIGNDFTNGDIFTEDSDPTNLPPGQSDNAVQNVYVNNGVATFTAAGDPINNVQNIYINPGNVPITWPLTVTISGTRVNVNAVTTQTNNILQDYALVISSDDPVLSNSLTIVTNLPILATNAPLITVAYSGVPLLHQRVGANEPNLYMSNGIVTMTNGSLSQWHFFIFTNSELMASNTTNVAFATFFPPNLSIPRASGSADIDLYVYAPATPLTDFASTLLVPGGLDTFAEEAIKSVGRTGNESVIFTNSTIPVYYIGVKSEDQQASDFGFYGIAQSNSFSTASSDGNNITATGTSLPVAIPTSLSPTPALAFAFMFNPNPVLQQIRRVTVTDGIQFGTPGSLYGTLQHNDLNTVLNNFSGNPGGYTNTYDDLQEDPNSGDVTSDGPGSLTQYVNQQADGLWLLSEANDDQSQSGFINVYTVSVDLQQPQGVGFFVTIPGQSWFDDYVLVPNDATNMIIYTEYENSTNGSGPIGIYLTNEVGIITANDYGSNGIVPPGGSLTLGTNYPVPGGPPWSPSTPPLAGGFWYYGIYNSSTTPVTLFVLVDIQESLTPNLVQTYTNSGPPVPLTTDAHTQSQICISNGQQLVDLSVGLRIADTNLDDLVIHLTSPEGTSVLLFEDRGGTNASNLGMTLVTSNIVTIVTNSMTNSVTNYSTNFVYTVFTEDTNLTTTPIKFAPPPFAADDITPATDLWSNSFETVTNGVYTNGAILEGWLVTNNIVSISTTNTNGTGFLTNDEVGIVTDTNGELIGTNDFLGSNYLALTSGRIVQTFGLTNTFTITNGMPYELVFYAKPMGIVDWWPADNNTDDIVGTNNGVMSSNVVFDDGEVDRAFGFDGVGFSPDFYTGNEVDFGTNAGNFGTNDFTVDFWIRQPTNAVGSYACLEKREICQASINLWEIEFGNEGYISPPNPPGHLATYIGDNNATLVTEISSTNAINDGFFHHVALTRKGNTTSYYIDGLLNNSVTIAGIANLNNSAMFRAGQSVCVSPGIDGSDSTQPFVGDLDELDLINRALSPAEVYAIYHAGSLGKYNTNSLLPNFNLTIDGVETNNILLTNFAGGWELVTNTFYATNNQVTIEFSGNAMGVLLDDIQLVQLAATNNNNYYLPEEPLTPFIGENPLGCWTLDVWDTRQDSPLPDNGTLLSWTMQVTTSSTNATLYVLTNDDPITITNTNATSESITYFAIDVPYYATDATNILTADSGGPLTLYFDQTALPTGGLPGDYTLAGGVAPGTPSTNVLAAQGAPPPLLPGQRYFLGVLNPAGSIFTVQVDFNGTTNIIIPLTNGILFTNVVGTNSSGTNGPEYYSFVVPTNAALVTFQILNSTNGEVDLYARDGLPVPGPLSFDYESRNAGTNDQFIAVTTNSVPVPLLVPSSNNVPPLGPSTWYLAAYNFAETNTNGYTIVATVVTNGQMDIIPLTNNVPFTNSAPPGYPTNVFYSFTITNSPAEVQFTVTNLTNMGNVELLASLNSLPTPQDFYSGSFNAGTNAQIIQITTNSQLPSLTGVWYLAVPNTSATNVPYVIEATTNLFIGSPLPPIKPLTWTGEVSGSPDGNWDILSTSNWVVTGSNPVTNYAFQNGCLVTFDDSATNGTTLVNLAAPVAPAGIIVNNDILTYTFSGGGNISGAPLTMNNAGMLIIDNTGANNFSSVTLNDGILQVGNNDANGSLGTSPVDTGSGSMIGPGVLVFDRIDNILVPNVISDNGSLAQIGTGILTLSGTNTFSGGTLISGGTIVVDNTSALGQAGGAFITGGGTLDLGGLAMANGPGNPLFAGQIFEISGDGVGSNGAIVNNGTNQQQGGLGAILLTGNTTIGGATRWDIRYDNVNNNLVLHNFTLTKTGSNQISLVSTFVDSGNIIINQGILSFEVTPDFSPSVGTITVNSNALVGQNLDTSNSFTRAIVLNGGGTTNLSGSNITYLDAPILLTNNSSLGNGGGIEIFDDIISGTFGLTNLGVGSNLLATNNTYSGATFIAQGTLALTNNGSITNSISITVASNATLDASQRVDQTLTLASNQTLFDSGTVLGIDVLADADSTVFGNGLVISNLTISAGAFLSPGAAAGTIGTLTVGGTAFLGGTSYMKLNQALAPVQTNDVLMASNAVVYGGTLIVTNLDATNSFVAGDSFKLYSTPNSSGAFSALILPPLPVGLAWSNTFAISGPGILSVVSTNNPSLPSPSFTSISLSGTNLVFSGTNGQHNGQFVVLTSTNLLLPLTNWTPVVTDFFDNLGDFNFTNPVTTNPAQFYILQSP